MKPSSPRPGRPEAAPRRPDGHEWGSPASTRPAWARASASAAKRVVASGSPRSSARWDAPSAIAAGIFRGGSARTHRRARTVPPSAGLASIARCAASNGTSNAASSPLTSAMFACASNRRGRARRPRSAAAQPRSKVAPSLEMEPRVGMAFDQSGGPRHVAGSDGVVHGLVGQVVRRMPGAAARGSPRPAPASDAGAGRGADRRTGGDTATSRGRRPGRSRTGWTARSPRAWPGRPRVPSRHRTGRRDSSSAGTSR